MKGNLIRFQALLTQIQTGFNFYFEGRREGKLITKNQTSMKHLKMLKWENKNENQEKKNSRQLNL